MGRDPVRLFSEYANNSCGFSAEWKDEERALSLSLPSKFFLVAMEKRPSKFMVCFRKSSPFI